MAKLWAKVNGTWVQLGAQTKDDIGLGNVQNFTFTNSATDGSSSKYATGSAVKVAYDRATQALNKANSSSSFTGESFTSGVSWSNTGDVAAGFNQVPNGHVITRMSVRGSTVRIGHRGVS